MEVGPLNLLVGLLPIIISGAEPVAPLGEFIKGMIVAQGPWLIEKREGWGDQVRIFDGFRIEGKGLKAKLTARKKPVNHGLWKHYKIWMDEPSRDLSVDFPTLEYVPDQGVRFVVEILAHMRGYVDLQQHSNGLQVFAAATDAQLDVRALVSGMVQVRWEATKLVPDLLLAPHVDDVRLELPNIDVERFGKLKGKLARETGDHFRKLLEDLLNDKDGKVTEKINREIGRRWEEGTLRLSATAFLASDPPRAPPVSAESLSTR